MSECMYALTFETFGGVLTGPIYGANGDQGGASRAVIVKKSAESRIPAFLSHAGKLH
jgi:hypothetical protein